MNPLLTEGIWEKIRDFPLACARALDGQAYEVPLLPGRDVKVVEIFEARGKPGLSSAEGQGRLLHDLASIELQAMELAFRTLVDYPDLSPEFRAGLSELAVSESRHLQMCLEALEATGFSWGHWPVHLALWSATSNSDSILDRLLIVHRYLEGGGLDAGVAIMKKLNGVADRRAYGVVETIVDEEIGHVSFGSYWYRRFCEVERIDAQTDFPDRISRLMPKIPRRLEKLNREIRKKAGFTDVEMDFLESLQVHKPWKESER